MFESIYVYVFICVFVNVYYCTTSSHHYPRKLNTNLHECIVTLSMLHAHFEMAPRHLVKRHSSERRSAAQYIKCDTRPTVNKTVTHHSAERHSSECCSSKCPGTSCSPAFKHSSLLVPGMIKTKSLSCLKIFYTLLTPVITRLLTINTMLPTH